MCIKYTLNSIKVDILRLQTIELLTKFTTFLKLTWFSRNNQIDINLFL